MIGGVVVSPVGHGLRAVFAGRQGYRANGEPAKHPPMVENRPSIAVLPFTNMSDDREQEFLYERT